MIERGVLTTAGRHFGYKRDLPQHRGQQQDVRAHLASFASQAIPDVFSLRSFAAPTEDQGLEGSCGGHGSSQGLATASMSLAHFNNTPLLIPFTPSQRSLYAVTRRIEIGDPSIALTDSGVYPTDLITTATYFGVRPMFVAQTPDGRFSDIWDYPDVAPLGLRSSNVNDDPNFGDLMTAGLRRQIGEYRIDEGSPDVGLLVRQTIAVAKVPVGVGIFVDSAVMNFTATSNPVGAPNTNDPNGGGHWITIDGYAKDAIGGWIYEIHNSWGSGYGDNGGFRGNDAWLRAATDLICWTIR